MNRRILYRTGVCVAAIASAILVQGLGMSQPSQSAASAPVAVRQVGVVTRIETGSLTLHTDAGTDVQIQLSANLTVLRVPPGVKDLKSATKIAVSDIHPGDRVLVRGQPADDQRSLAATSVIVMSKSDLESAHQAERMAWQQRGIGGLIKAVNPEAKEITISVPNVPPTPGNPTHPVAITLAPNAVLLRYAPDSVKFSDAKPSSFEQIKVGDQVRALGSKSEDGAHYSAEKLVSGSFRTLGATVVSLDTAKGTLTVKDLASGLPLVVRTNTDSQLHRLPERLAQMIAMLNSGAGPGAAGAGTAPSAKTAKSNGSPASGGGGWPSGGHPGQEAGQGEGVRDINRMLEHTPVLTLSELKPGDAVIVVSTEGTNPSEITAITLLAGVEPILAAQPKGSSPMSLGSWSMGMGGGADTGAP